MHSRILDFLKHTHFFSDSQHGFRSERSTESAIFRTWEKILNLLDQGFSTVGIYYDLSKAFDNVNHSVLLKKMEAAGIRGNVLSWIQSFLNDRSQFVELSYTNGNISNCKHKSQKIKLQKGTPQGSVLSPLLFLIFCNDLQSFFDSIKNCYLTQFADDTSTVTHNKNNLELKKLNEDVIGKMIKYCELNGLALNQNKTSLIQFCLSPQKQIDFNIIISGEPVKQEPSVKFLGLHLQGNASWSLQIDCIAKKMCSANYIIRSMKHCLSTHSLLLFYNAFVLSRLTYCIVFWGAHSDVQRLLILQKKLSEIFVN